MTSFDYAYKLEAVRDWLFAQTKLSVPLLALLLSFFGLIFVFLIYPENAPPIKSGALYQNTVPLPPKQSSERMAVFLLWNKEASIQASLFSHSEIPKFLKGNIKLNFKLIIPVYYAEIK